MVFTKSDESMFNLRFSDVNLCSDNINKCLVSWMGLFDGNVYLCASCHVR